MLKKKENNKRSQSLSTGTSHALNSLVRGTSVEGTIHSESDIRIDGSLKGNLNCKSKVIIGPEGRIEGNVQCHSAVIEGKLDGHITVAELLNVRETAEINGEVFTEKLIVQSGAKFNVTCTMGASAQHANVSGQKSHESNVKKQKLEHKKGESPVQKGANS